MMMIMFGPGRQKFASGPLTTGVGVFNPLITGVALFRLCYPPHFLTWSLIHGLFAGGGGL